MSGPMNTAGVPRDQYKPINSTKHKGAQPGRKNINWMVGDFALVKIAMQLLYEQTNPEVWRTRDFGGTNPVKKLLYLIEKEYPRIYEALLVRDSPPGVRTEAQMLNVLYQRGYLGFYDNTKERKNGVNSRACRSKEHYSHSPRLIPRIDEAYEAFGELMGLSRTASRRR